MPQSHGTKVIQEPGGDLSNLDGGRLGTVGPGPNGPIVPACMIRGLRKLRSSPLNMGNRGRAQEARPQMTFPRALARYTRGAVNQMAVHVAGHAALADLEHTGRKSGAVRHTPVRAFRTGDTVVIGLNFWRQSDWYQNIKEDGSCRMRLDGQQFTLGAPLLVPVEQGVKDMPWLFGFALRHIVRTTECVQLPIVDASALAGDISLSSSTFGALRRRRRQGQ